MNNLPTLDEYKDHKLFAEAPDQEARDIAADAIDAAGAEYFLKQNPGYHATERNAELLTGWCSARGVPTTSWNLTIAWRELRNALETAPSPTTGSGPNPSITLSISDRLATYDPSDEERRALEKVKDDPNLSDAQRKNRDQKLRILARDQRLAIRRVGGVPWQQE